MSISLTKVFAGISDYVQKHEDNYTLIEDNINALLSTLGGSAGSISVPAGLQEIFDRAGIIGKASYQLTNQTVVADTLSIPAGAAWINLGFRKKTTSTSLSTASLTTGTRYLNIDSAGLPALATSSSSESIYSFAWNSGSKVISSVTLLVPILFDGDDYNDSLSSTALATSFTSLAERFENVETLVGVLGSYYAQDTGTTTGLTFGYKAGKVRNDNVLASTAAGTIAMSDASTNYVEVNPTTGVVSKNTTAFTTLLVPLFEVTTSGGVITGVVDQRTWASLAGAGGGGHTQNTDTGTSSTSFTLNNAEAGTPSANVSLMVERGTSPNTGIRWNETTDIFEQTVDGTTWTPIGAPDLGQQELCKMVTFEDPVEVVNLTGHTTDSGYVKVDLTANINFTSIVSGVQGMMLRVQYDDSAPDASTTVLFRKIENPVASPTESMRVYARDSADYNDNEGTMILVSGEGRDMSDVLKIGFEYLATTSGAGTANLKVFVVGYWEKVTGAGTQEVAFSSTGNVVGAGATVQFNLPGFVNRGMSYKITITETTGTPTAVYHVNAYSKDTFLSADLQYSVTDIDPATPFVDYRTINWRDKDGSAELHIQIENTDAASGTYDIVIEAERFA